MAEPGTVELGYEPDPKRAMKRRGVILILLSLFLYGSGTAIFSAKIEEQAHWSFQPVKRPPVPAGGNPIDAFVSSKLKEHGLSRNGAATPRELIRRAYFDLIGLPPSLEEVSAFEDDSSVEAFGRVVDRLLASPQYGERWGRHWLDLVRFAQSNGYERDGEKLLAWRYRDYVIKAFNEDKPYDRFVMEQIAGDELPDGTADAISATGFQRLGVFDDEPDDKRMAEFDALDDVVSTTGTTFLGLTLGCARCHDHKFDPIPQTDYYSLLAFFRGVRHFESAPPAFDSPGFSPLGSAQEIRHWRAWKEARLKSLEQQRSTSLDEKKRKQIEAEIKKAKEDVPYEWTLAVRESGKECPATHVLARGNASAPRGEVQPAFPQCLTNRKPTFHEQTADAVSSGRRSVLAEWIASAENPLTSRVVVNRIWQHHFGQGLVKTTTDFGRAGSGPSHPELLDWLAAEFVDQGWSLKRMHKLIMTSATYRQSSHVSNDRAATIDPDNRLLWRQNMRRLEAEALRDTVLAISGALNTKMSGRGFFPHLAGEVLAGQSRPGLDWDVSSEAEQSRRSVYAFVRRTMGVPLFEAFDYSNTTSPLPERAVTTVAPQALMLLNDSFMQKQSAGFAERLCRETTCGAQITKAYAIAFNRKPSVREMQTALAFLEKNERSFDALGGRMTFQLDVPNALSTEYFEKLSPNQYYAGPGSGWSYYRGEWAPPYEGIRVAVREQAPFALCDQIQFQNGTIETDVLLAKSTESAGLLFRAKAEKEKVHGYEVVLLPKSGRIELRRHSEKMQMLAANRAALKTGTTQHLTICADDGYLRVSLDAHVVLETTDQNPIDPVGMFGIRAWGGPVSLENIQLTTGEGKNLVQAENKTSKQRALESFCLLLLNLNELMYVD